MSALKKILKEEDTVDLTPMIDVTFLLLIYFMVTTMLKQPEAELAIQLPGKPKPGANIKVMPRYKVMIEELGDVYINGGSLIEDGSDIQMKELAALLKEEREGRDAMIRTGRATKEEAELVVEIESHPGAEHQSTVSVLNACGLAGVKRITFVF